MAAAQGRLAQVQQKPHCAECRRLRLAAGTVGVSGLGLLVSEVAKQLGPEPRESLKRDPGCNWLRWWCRIKVDDVIERRQLPQQLPRQRLCSRVCRLTAAILSDSELSAAAVPPAAQPAWEDLMQLVRDERAKRREQGLLLGPGRSQEHLEHGTTRVVWAADISMDLAGAMLLQQRHRAWQQRPWAQQLRRACA